MGLSNDGLRLPPPWITPAAGLPDREVPPVIIIQRRGLLYPAYVQDYLDRVTAADVAAGDSNGLELGVTDAISSFLQDLVSISYLGVSANVISQAASVIKASPILAGARTRAGSLVPVVGTAPTGFGTAGGWNYNRKTGLQGNGTDNYLNANRLQNADTQNNFHMSLYSSNGIAGTAMGSSPATGSTTPADSISAGAGASDLRFRSRYGGVTETDFGNRAAAGFYGHSRTSSTGFTARSGGSDTSITTASSAPGANPMHIFRRPFSASPTWSTSRVAFYSIGGALTLSLLEARVLTLINAFAAAIP